MSTESCVPLNYGELANVADLYVIADHAKCFYTEGSQMDVACKNLECVPIFDAESELVCFAPRDKVDYLARLINTYQHLTPDGERSA